LGELKVGIIGSGGIARGHARAYKELPYVDIVGVCDIVPGKAQSFIEAEGLEGAKAFESHEDLFALGVDAVSVCTPNVAHHSMSVAALNAGVHVLVEKPLAVTLDQAIDMVRAAKKTNRILSVGFQPRYDPNSKVIKEIVQSGELGKIYYVETGGGRRRGMPGGTFIKKEIAGAGAMADIGCYSLDLVLNALGHPKPLTVSAATYNYFGTSPKYHPQAAEFDVEDFGAALVRLEGGITLLFKISWAMHMDTLGATFFLGTDAGLKLTPAGSGPWSGVWDGGVGSITLYYDKLGHLTESPIPVKQHRINIFAEKVKDFARAVREGDKAPIPADEILYNQAIIDGVLRSAEAGREVEIVIPEI